MYNDESICGYEVKRTIHEMTIADAMGQDFSIWLGYNKKFGFDMVLEGETPEDSVEEVGIHPYAIESFASLCRRFLYFYDNLQEKAA